MLKPQHRIMMIVGAMLLAAGLSYTILINIQLPSAELAKTSENMETSRQGEDFKATTVRAPRPSMVGKMLPDVTFYDAEGKPLRLADFAGEILLVNLWATWCPPCVAELPALDTLQARLRDRGLHVLPISLDNKPVSEVAGFLAARRVEQISLYIDTDRQIPMKWTYAGIPASFLIGRDGVVIEQFDGPREWDKGAVFDALAAQLEKGR
jgi:thiol-disulfide isomerase/thioredoxin